VTGLGFYLYFTRIIKTLQKELIRPRPPPSVKESIIIRDNGHAANKPDTTVIGENKEYL
jgi:hypothetical protein